MKQSRANKKQVSNNIVFVPRTTMQFNTSCKSRHPEVIVPVNNTESNTHPMDWGKMDRDSQSFIELGKQYLHQIREVNRSLNLIIESTKAETYSNSPKGSLVTILGLAGSQAKINELFAVANTIFPSD